MPKFAANLTMLFGDVPFLDRFARAAKAGFTGVEYLFPYDYKADDLAARLEEHRLTQVLHNLPAGDWARGERGIACHPGRVSEFRDGVDQAIGYAAKLGCSRLNCLSGITPSGISEEQARTTFTENLRFAAGRLRSADIKLLIEPINTRDIPGFFLHHTQQALDIIAEVGSDNLFLQYDVYHMQIMEGDLTSTITRCLPAIAHMQVADPPARNEPGTGEVNFTYLFDVIDRLGYSGWVGCEYKPTARTEEGLGWLRPYLSFAA